MRVSTVYLIIFGTVLTIIFMNNTQVEAMYVSSEFDDKPYLVRNEKDKKRAANMLSKIRANLFYFRDYLYKNKDNYGNYKKYIETMYKKMEHMIISENTPNSSYTSYTVNKGEEMIFCIRSKKDDSIHDINLLMFVAVHELSHVACPEEGHTELFGEIFGFMLGESIKCNIYVNQDFKIHPREYCGMEINSGPTV